MDVHPDYAIFVGNVVGKQYQTMFVAQTQRDSEKVKAWVDRQRPSDRFSTMLIENPEAARYPFEVTDELRRLGVVGWLDEGMLCKRFFGYRGWDSSRLAANIIFFIFFSTHANTHARSDQMSARGCHCAA